MAMLADWNVSVQGLVRTDANAAMGIAHRQGLGKTRHIEVQYLWVQDEVKRKTLKVNKVGPDDNPADMLTKHLKAETILKHMQFLRCTSTSTKLSSSLKIHCMSQWCQDLRARRASMAAAAVSAVQLLQLGRGGVLNIVSMNLRSSERMKLRKDRPMDMYWRQCDVSGRTLNECSSPITLKANGAIIRCIHIHSDSSRDPLYTWGSSVITV